MNTQELEIFNTPDKDGICRLYDYSRNLKYEYNASNLVNIIVNSMMEGKEIELISSSIPEIISDFEMSMPSSWYTIGKMIGYYPRENKIKFEIYKGYEYIDFFKYKVGIYGRISKDCNNFPVLENLLYFKLVLA